MNNRLLLVLFLLLSGLCVYGFLTLYERYEEEVDLGWDEAALRNPYLAAERFLQQRGVEIQTSAHSIAALQLPPDGTLILSNANLVLHEAQAEQLWHWMQQGGRLVLGIPRGEQSNPLLQRFGLQSQLSTATRPRPSRTLLEQEIGRIIEEPEEGESQTPVSERLREYNERMREAARQDARQETAAENAAPRIHPEEITELQVQDGFPLQAQFDYWGELRHPFFHDEDYAAATLPEPFNWAGSGAGFTMLQFKVGEGSMTALIDASIWRSDRIDRFDHAYLLELLGGSGPVILLFGLEMPALPRLVWRYAPEAVLLGMVLLLAWLVYRGRRFGAIQIPQGETRRSIAEHIHASADYLWRHRLTPKLLAPLREEIWQRARRINPRLARLPEAEQRQWLSRHCELPLAEIEHALDAQPGHQEQPFLAVTALLQQLRTRL